MALWGEEFEPQEEVRRRDWVPAEGLSLRSLSLDAHLLDKQISKQLRDELATATSLLNPRQVLSAQPEILLLLELVTLAATVGCNRPTAGMKILSLKWQQTNRKEQDGLSARQRLILCLVVPGSTWFSQRFQSYARRRNFSESEVPWESLAWRGFCLATLSSHIVKAANLCLFFRQGRYSTVFERVLGVSKTYEDPLIIRSSALGVLDDHLFWAQLYDFVTVITPFLSARKQQLKNLAVDWSHALKRFGVEQLQNVGLIKREKAQTGEEGEVGMAGNSRREKATCGICGTDAIVLMSYAHPCRHPYCYHCLALHLSTFKDFSCRVCDKKVEGISR
jgi:peroxin-2